MARHTSVQITEEVARDLEAAARLHDLSVNAYLAELLEADRRRQLRHVHAHISTLDLSSIEPSTIDSTIADARVEREHRGDL